MRTQCCANDGGRPAGFGVRALKPNHLSVLRLRAVVLSERKRGRFALLQVGSRELSKTEPLSRRREVKNGVKTGNLPTFRDKRRGDPITDLRGIRRIGGRNLNQALARNTGTSRCDVKGEIQAGDPARVRAPKRSTGTDRSVVAMKLGKPGGAKGSSHSGLNCWSTAMAGGIDG